MPDQNKKLKHRVPFYRRPVVIVSGLLAVIVVAFVVFLVVKALAAKNPEVASDQPSEETSSALVYDDSEDMENDLPPEDQKNIVQYEGEYSGENPNDLDRLTGLITYTEVKDGSLMAMVSIDQYLGDGTCKASLKIGEQTVATVEQPIEADASTSHCGPISIGLAGISSGKYQLEVVLASGGKTGTITSNVEI